MAGTKLNDCFAKTLNVHFWPLEARCSNERLRN
jgi:hypothetical protein